MDERKPSSPPSEFRLRSASGWTAADIDPPPAVLAKSDEPVALAMTISGKIHQAANVFVRFRSSDDYYAARANALENNVNLYRVVAGRREMIGCMKVNVSGQAWHRLGVAARDDRLTVFLGGRELFVTTDRRFPEPAGKLACGPMPTA
jgi:hypothetical protein